MIDSHPQSALLPQLRIGQSFGTKCGLSNLFASCMPACVHTTRQCITHERRWTRSGRLRHCFRVWTEDRHEVGRAPKRTDTGLRRRPRARCQKRLSCVCSLVTLRTYNYSDRGVTRERASGDTREESQLRRCVFRFRVPAGAAGRYRIRITVC